MNSPWQSSASPTSPPTLAETAPLLSSPPLTPPSSPCFSCSVPRILAEHIVSGLLSFSDLQYIAAHGTRIETMNPGHCITLTSGGSVADVVNNKTERVFVDAVEITQPDLWPWRPSRFSHPPAVLLLFRHRHRCRHIEISPSPHLGRRCETSPRNELDAAGRNDAPSQRRLRRSGPGHEGAVRRPRGFPERHALRYGGPLHFLRSPKLRRQRLVPHRPQPLPRDRGPRETPHGIHSGDDGQGEGSGGDGHRWTLLGRPDQRRTCQNPRCCLPSAATSALHRRRLDGCQDATSPVHRRSRWMRAGPHAYRRLSWALILL
ncbi:hypothetical protein SAY86_016328 [Trapa natans]|uniref:BPL/LPL catalytic domain-containing protein n=1 Tax=Trapa natans TaxID=22666 RepID=A0AAN7LK19_TRANT|nr:hypothetical protein SAY86_016328 [Trapa natans]